LSTIVSIAGDILETSSTRTVERTGSIGALMRTIIFTKSAFVLVVAVAVNSSASVTDITATFKASSGIFAASNRFVNTSISSKFTFVDIITDTIGVIIISHVTFTFMSRDQVSTCTDSVTAMVDSAFIDVFTATLDAITFKTIITFTGV